MNLFFFTVINVRKLNNFSIHKWLRYLQRTCTTNSYIHKKFRSHTPHQQPHARKARISCPYFPLSYGLLTHCLPHVFRRPLHRAPSFHLSFHRPYHTSREKTCVSLRIIWFKLLDPDDYYFHLPPPPPPPPTCE